MGDLNIFFMERSQMQNYKIYKNKKFKYEDLDIL